MENVLFEPLRKVKIIGETALLCKTMKNACGVIDTGCMMHAVSLAPHAKYDTYLFTNFPTPPLEKYINIRGPFNNLEVTKSTIFSNSKPN
jgi:hypothetical protein